MNKSNDWMPLGQGYSLVAAAEQSAQLAEHRLVQVLKTGELRHRVGHAILGRFKSDRREVLNEPVPDGFFGPDGFWGWPSKIDWLKSEALRGGSQFYHAFRIDVNRDDLERLWPASAAGSGAAARQKPARRKPIKKNRLCEIMRELGPKIRLGMEPHEVEEVIKGPYKKKWGDPIPSRRRIDEAYHEFLATADPK